MDMNAFVKLHDDRVRAGSAGMTTLDPLSEATTWWQVCRETGYKLTVAQPS